MASFSLGNNQATTVVCKPQSALKTYFLSQILKPAREEAQALGTAHKSLPQPLPVPYSTASLPPFPAQQMATVEAHLGQGLPLICNPIGWLGPGWEGSAVHAGRSGWLQHRLLHAG